MPKQIVLRDKLYHRLWELKGDRSFSWIIERLLEGRPIEAKVSASELLQVLQKQNQVLEEMLRELKALNRRLSSLRLEVKEANVREVKAVTDGKRLPSYLENNPWVEILSEMR